MCHFKYDPIRFERNQDLSLRPVIKTESFEKLENYVLRFRDNQNDQILREKDLERKLIKIKTSKDETELLAFTAQASIKLDSLELSRKNPYVCCIEKQTVNQGEKNEGVCSYLRFDSSIPLNFKYEQELFSQKDIKEFSSKVNSLQKTTFICGALFIVTLLCLVGMGLYLNMSNKRKAEAHLVNNTNPSLFTVALPTQDQTTSTILIDDLYTRYNLTKDSSIEKLEIDCTSEFPPSYEQCAPNQEKKF